MMKVSSVRKRWCSTAILIVFAAAMLAASIAPAYASTGAGNALDFDGTNDYVDCGDINAIDGISKLTIEAWGNWRTLDRLSTIASKRQSHLDKIQFGLGESSNTNDVRIQIGTGSLGYGYTTGNIISTDTWYHVAMVFDGSKTGNANRLKFYLNGVQQPLTYSGTLPSTTCSNSAVVTVGAEDRTAGCTNVDGQIDEVRIWNTARTEAQIHKNMNRKLTGSESGLVTYYRFDESSGTLLHDSTPNNNNGALQNMANGDWVISRAAVGDESHFGTGTSNLIENADVPVDITWDGDTPGATAIFAAIQNDAAPDVTAGLLAQYPPTYWELAIANNDVFKADVTFHYDDISGLGGKESAFCLYTRSNAGESWSEVADITRNNEGSDTDGIGSITVNDLTGFSQFIITYSDDTTPSTGAGNALDFDGTNDYVDCGDINAIDGISKLTIEAWGNWRTLDRLSTIASKRQSHLDKIQFGLGESSNTNDVRIQIGTGSLGYGYTTGNIISTDTWYHVAMVFDGSKTGNANRLKFYLNGVQQPLTYSGTLPSTTCSNSAVVTVGAEDRTAGCTNVDGQIDEVRIWNTARTEAQIHKNMNRKLTGSESGLVTYYRFDESSGTLLHDSTPNNNNGALQNMANGDWVISRAAVGDESHFGTGTSNLIENADVPVDITWDGDTPGATAIFAAIQNDAAPDVTAGLLAQYPPTYWELAIANNDVFKADVTFHYDDISGLGGKESAFCLYTRSNAGESWSEVADITRNNEGSDTDGIGSITVNDLTGFSQFIITYSDDTTPSTGAGNALDFDGTNDYVDCGDINAIDGISKLTIEAWGNWRTLDRLSTIASKRQSHLDKIQFGLGESSNTNDVRIQIGTGSLGYGYTTGNIISTDTWYHVAMVFDGSKTGNANRLKFYLNGVQQPLTYSGTLPSTTCSNSAVVTVGAEDRTAGCTNVDGQIDEVRIWNTARTEAQIHKNMNRKLTGSESGLVTYYRFDESSGTLLHDSTPNNNNGALQNMANGDWVISRAAVGDESHFGTGTSNLIENADVPVDITWDGDTPGATAIFAAIQNDAAPDVTAGLLAQYPSTYWELAIANNDVFKADVTFHYDDISGLGGKESAFCLYTRSNAGESWSEVADITRNNEGSDTDGIGSITVNDLTGFSQFIITYSDDTTPPVIRSVVLDPTEVAPNGSISVTVTATDDSDIAVTANGIVLALVANDTYKGTITAASTPGTYNVTVVATDASSNSNVATDDSATYTVQETVHPATLYIEDVVVRPGENMSVPIKVFDVVNMSSCEINFTYDSTVVRITDVIRGDLRYSFKFNVNNGSGWMRANALDVDGLSGNVTFAHLTLTAVGNKGDVSEMEFEDSRLLDTSFKEIVHITRTGTFSIRENVPPEVTNVSATPDTILYDNGRLRASGTNITLMSAHVTDTDGNITTVTIDLSSIGGSPAQPMEHVSGDTWDVTTNATEVAITAQDFTHQLTITATDNDGGINDPVSINLTVLKRGDVDGNGLVDEMDVDYISNYVAGLEPEASNPPGVLVGDVVGEAGCPMGDGVVDMMDALYIAKYTSGRVEEP